MFSSEFHQVPNDMETVLQLKESKRNELCRNGIKSAETELIVPERDKVCRIGTNSPDGTNYAETELPVPERNKVCRIGTNSPERNKLCLNGTNSVGTKLTVLERN